MSMWPHPLTASMLRSKYPVSQWLPDVTPPADLQRVARAAMEAAVDAGASYADIRIGDRRDLQIYYGQEYPMGNLGFDLSYGLRVCVDGVWGFGYGIDPSSAGVAETARTTVAQVKRLSAVAHGPRITMRPVPVATGAWDTPVEIDPFAISPDDHIAMLAAYWRSVTRVRGAEFSPSFKWKSERRIFASTEGSLVTQTFASVMPYLWNSIECRDPLAFRDGDNRWHPDPVFGGTTGGFEIALGTAMQDRFKAYTEDAVRWISYPTVNHFPVGRYDAIFDGVSAASLLGSSIIPALSPDRSTISQDATFLQPVESTLGTRVFSPLLTLTADRSLPHLGAARWDDEGVATQTFPIVREGTVVEFFDIRGVADTKTTSVRDAHPVRGCATALSPTRMPVGAGTCVTMTPNSSARTLDDMIRELGNGVLLRTGSRDRVSLDTSFGNGLLVPALCYEVKHGRVTRQLLGAGVQFASRKLWRGLTGVGDANTMESFTVMNWYGHPPTLVLQHVRSPAVQFKDVSVIDLAANRS